MLTFGQHAHRACFRAWSGTGADRVSLGTSIIFDHIRRLTPCWSSPQRVRQRVRGFNMTGAPRVRPRVHPENGPEMQVVHSCSPHGCTLFAISPVSGCPGNIHSHWPVVWWPSTWYHRWKWLPWLLARLWKATSSIFVSTHNWKHSPVFSQWLSINLHRSLMITYDHLSQHCQHLNLRLLDPSIRKAWGLRILYQVRHCGKLKSLILLEIWTWIRTLCILCTQWICDLCSCCPAVIPGQHIMTKANGQHNT